MYHYNLTAFISGPSPNGPGDLRELRAVFHRVLQSGLASLPEDGFDEESLDVDRPGSPAESITALEFDDPRAIDFRNYLRTWCVHSMFSPFSRAHTGLEKVWESPMVVHSST